MQFLEKFRRFMYGRYGMDKLNQFLLILSLILTFLSRFDRRGLIYILSVLSFAYCIFRFLSKNIYKRSYENDKYLKFSGKIRNFYQLRASHIKQRKTHHIYSCPTCRQKIRVPRGKGRICISCPRCHTEFIKKS